MLPLLTLVTVGLGAGLASGSPVPAPSSPMTVESPTSPTSPIAERAPLWQPAVGASWQIVLSDALNISPTATSLNPAVSIYDIDMYANSNKTMATLHRLGAKVICYFSAGSWEPYRPDSNAFKAADLGKGMDGWPDEKWVDVRSANVRAIMAQRIKLAAQKGCDAIDPDNMDGYSHDTGFPLTQADLVSYVKFLASTAASVGLSTGLKNAGDIIPQVLAVTHFAVNEQCAEYAECAVTQPYIKAGKPVFRIEYPPTAPKVSSTKRSSLCRASGSGGFSTVLKKMSLDGWVMYCNGSTAKTPVET